MARKSPAEKFDDLVRITRAWERLRADRSYFGLTLDQFKQATQPSFDARAEIADLTQRLNVAIENRDAADKQSFRIVRGVAYAIQGDPNEGDDGGELYAAMGYVPWVVRRGPRKRGPRRS